MLSVITKPRVFRSYLVYDLEWIPGKFSPDGTMKVRLVGVYDGERYRAYSSVEAFLENELTSKNRGKWFYAHAGGLADFQFLLEVLIRKYGNKYTIKASPSGSSLIIVHVKSGKNVWHFVDSLWLLKDKLENIGKWIGIEKGQQKLKGAALEEWFRSAPLLELREYNEIDCVILYKAIQMFESVVFELGGQLKMTQASCAMELFRRRFLEKSIETSMPLNEISRKSYFASRVEVISRHCEDALYYDVNSSFPYAMTFPVPGECIERLDRRKPDYGIYIADVDIEVPEQYIPPIPTRMGGRLFFPVGSWRAWLTNVDIELLESVGGRVLKVYESRVFEPRLDLREYARTLYSIRAKSEGFMKIAVKFLLNSLYGKFAEGDMKQSIEINPATIKGSDEGWRMLFPGCFIVEKQVPIPHMHVPISAHITAIARRTLYHYMACTSEVHYCDTDGFSTTTPLQSVEGVLGKLKLEKVITRGRFATQKVYHIEGQDEHGKELGNKGVKAKGFSAMTVEKFEKILEGEEITYTRMARSRELLRGRQIVPVERTYRKRMKFDNLTKRMFYPDGQSRPWTIEELRSALDDSK
jgi:hypothetical protein